jgi:hypothetical protein
MQAVRKAEPPKNINSSQVSPMNFYFILYRKQYGGHDDKIQKVVVDAWVQREVHGLRQLTQAGRRGYRM